MSNKKHLFTSESVTEGHPDKICDQISDAILDRILEQDSNARVACETFVNTGMVLVSGEITTTAIVNITNIVRETLKNIGYVGSKFGIDYNSCAILTSIDEQSPDISEGVNISWEDRDNKNTGGEYEIGAGDQGIMFGYANNETEELMPLPISLAHKLAHQLTKVRKDKVLDYLGPDGKSQVTVEYDEHGNVIRIDTIIISSQHLPEVKPDAIYNDLIEYVIQPIIPSGLIDSDTKYLINPSGKFVIGGPQGDAGLTGRKIIVDTYGGFARHGGGAFSGKDPSKVDRTAAYAARYIAKNIVASKLAEVCEVQLAFAIGVSKPVSIHIDTFGSSTVPEQALEELVKRVFDLTTAGMINMLELKQPIFGETAAYGHFGREDLDLPWEKCDKVCELQEALNEKYLLL